MLDPVFATCLQITFPIFFLIFLFHNGHQTSKPESVQSAVLSYVLCGLQESCPLQAIKGQRKVNLCYVIVSNSQLLVSCDQYKHSVAVGAPEGVSAKTHLLRPRKLALLQHLKPLVT